MDVERAGARREVREEGEGFTGGPGVVASKSQARGALVWTVVGTIAGALLGLLGGSIVFGGAGTAIAAVVGAVAGATFGGTAGGFLAPRRRLDGTEADR